MGQQCYEVPVGFKYISAKMAETNAVIGGESSGGMSGNVDFESPMVRVFARGIDGAEMSFTTVDGVVTALS